MTFEVQQNNIGKDLLQRLLGETSGLSNFKIELIGDGRAFGIFQDDPFGLESGVVLSTGKVEELPGQNISDGGFSPGISVPLEFKKLPGQVGKTGVFVAELSEIDFDINSITFADSGSGEGGSEGRWSGFDLDAIKVSNALIESAKEINLLQSLDVFDFSPARTTFEPGTQRPTNDPNFIGDLNGTINGNIINNQSATLESFDSTNGFKGVTLGDGGKIGFDLKTSISSTGLPLYLYVGEYPNTGETPSGKITVSNRPINGFSDLSTDFGLPGEDNDSISMEIEFDADETAEQLYFQFAFGSEEFAEYAGQFNDNFSLKLNGFNLARLSDESAVTINNISSNPFDSSNPDYIYNSVDEGAASSETKLDGYTKPLTFVGPLLKNSKNTLEINVKDARDGLLDSAVFIKGDTFGTVELPPINTGNDGGDDNETPPKPPTDGDNGGNGDDFSTLIPTPEDLIFLPGDGSQTQLKFTLTESSAKFVNELGVFVADNEEGEINGISPGESGYLQAVLEQGQVVFSALSNNQFSDVRIPRQLTLNTGKYLGFYLVQNNTADQVLSDLNTGKTPANVFFATTAANADNFDHLQISELDEGVLSLAWEEVFGGGDADFNDMVVQLEVASEPPPIGNTLQGAFQGEIIDLTQEEGKQLQLSFKVGSEAGFQNVAGLYQLADEDGTVLDPLTGEAISPGEPGYTQAALQRSIVEFDRNGTEGVILEGGELYAPYMLANGNQNDAYFPYLGVNSDSLDHLRLLGDNTFAFEDLPSIGDSDFNDMIFSVDITVI
ncbi:MAG: choice-of-anchor L domain-containing protein [Calothrix sp. MO_192.B10]|nr:choice-of-anchor L domain-containing protein [Calothrix sp. MO_192.B10]